MSSKILVIDIESTALRPQQGSIVEVGIVELDLDNGEKKLIFDSTCHCKQELLTLDHVQNSWIVKEGYMTVEEIQKSPDFRTIKDKIQAIVDKYPNGATAFNRVFDIGFLKYYGITFGKLIPCPMLLSTDICKLPSKFKKGGYKWPRVEEAFEHFFPNVDYTEIHRGGDDALHEADIVYALYKAKAFSL
jgi:DNA polymerase-3 subunit epsilon